MRGLCSVVSRLISFVYLIVESFHRSLILCQPMRNCDDQDHSDEDEHADILTPKIGGRIIVDANIGSDMLQCFYTFSGKCRCRLMHCGHLFGSQGSFEVLGVLCWQ